MKRIALSVLALAASAGFALANGDITPVAPARYRNLSCDEIAMRIQQLNVPISNDSSTLAGLQRAHNPVLFFFTGFGSRTPDYDASLALARGERNALIAVAVKKDCASQRLIPSR